MPHGRESNVQSAPDPRPRMSYRLPRLGESTGRTASPRPRPSMSRPSRPAIAPRPRRGLHRARSKFATPAGASNTAPLRVARQLSDGLHPVTSPAVSRSGMIYATISGPRGKETPVSVVRISPDGRGTPFVTGITERHRPRLHARRRSLRHLPRRRQCLSHRSRRRVHRLCRRHGRSHRRRVRRRGQSLCRRPQRHLFKINPQRQIFVHATLEPTLPPTTWRSTPMERSSSPHPRFHRTMPSGPSTPTARPAPGSAASAARRASRSPRRATSISPPASTAVAAWCASHRNGEAFAGSRRNQPGRRRLLASRHHDPDDQRSRL